VTTLEDERNAALVAWYDEHRRPLPWRTATDPYRVLVSELMLQQTRVERVIPFYETFLDRFPTIEALAEAPFVDVAGVWSGLGYNRRAKSLHRTARAIVADGWPDSVAGLEELPGVGPYTARAVASIAYGIRVPAVDTNLRRVLSRWHGEQLDGAALTAAAEGDIDVDAGKWNQAMMDLGAALCRPRAPRCDVCPVHSWCAGPEVYSPPRRQARFEGSLRQIRGAVVRHLVTGASSLEDLVRATGFDAEDLEDAVDSLIDDEFVEETEDGTFELSED
jgi:A/G-specific adenine glycosylase